MARTHNNTLQSHHLQTGYSSPSPTSGDFALGLVPGSMALIVRPRGQTRPSLGMPKVPEQGTPGPGTCRWESWRALRASHIGPFLGLASLQIVCKHFGRIVAHGSGWRRLYSAHRNVATTGEPACHPHYPMDCVHYINPLPCLSHVLDRLCGCGRCPSTRGRRIPEIELVPAMMGSVHYRPCPPTNGCHGFCPVLGAT